MTLDQEKPLLKKLPGNKCKTFPIPVFSFYSGFNCTQKCNYYFHFFCSGRDAWKFSLPWPSFHKTSKNTLLEAWSHFGLHGAAWCCRKPGSPKSDRLRFVCSFSYLPTCVIYVTWINHLITSNYSLLIHQMGVLIVSTLACSFSL